MKNNQNTTIYIARIFSAYLIVTGLGFLLSPEFFARMITTTGSDPVLINLSGMVHFFIGATILVLHFRWRKALEILTSLLGVFTIAKGAFLIVLPELALQTGGNEFQMSLIGPAIGFLVYGIITAYFAWKHKAIN